MPVHAEGNAVWKELEALKDTVLEMKKLVIINSVTFSPNPN